MAELFSTLLYRQPGVCAASSAPAARAELDERLEAYEAFVDVSDIARQLADVLSERADSRFEQDGGSQRLEDSIGDAHGFLAAIRSAICFRVSANSRSALSRAARVA